MSKEYVDDNAQKSFEKVNFIQKILLNFIQKLFFPLVKCINF